MAESKKNIYQKLVSIQNELKVNKNQHNDYGNFNYRSAEDILSALKPLLAKEDVTIIMSDEVVVIEGKRYLKAVVKFIDCADGTIIENSALAGEPQGGKKMDESQLTGCASSYARKYALNGLFLLDDNKDADTNEYQKQKSEESPKANAPKTTYQKANAPKTVAKAPAQVANANDETPKTVAKAPTKVVGGKRGFSFGSPA